MNLCRVLGTVVCTEKLPVFTGRKLLVVQPVDEALKEIGTSYVAMDNTSSAGKGDLVLVLGEGSGVRQILEDKTAAVRHLIVGVVDQVSVG
ncbi:MAG: EutN/CcmL family microcompartment protein [Myxococcales bacterium]|nr:EutN/CcmL family microcompartment protein [Myxococcales bacterium]MDP3500170.1 EutN/CcmL family microcompartment protein [Myxococcales bacterium]